MANPGATDPCAAAGHSNDAGCYLDFGQVWNNIGQFDQEAIALFNRSELALKTIADPQVRLRKKAFLCKSWGWALSGERDCKDAIPKFREAESMFESNNFNDADSLKGLASTKDGLAFTQKCE